MGVLSESQLPVRTDPSAFLSLRLLSIGILLPAFGVFICVVYTLTIGSDAISTLTLARCPEVKSALPPISYAIGIWQPQKIIWFTFLLLHLPARLMLSMMLPQVWLPGAGRVWLYSSYSVEAVSIVLVTVLHVDSIAGFHIHAFFFTTWALGAIFSMSLSIHLMRITRLKNRNAMFRRFFIFKCLLLGLFLFSICSVGLFYPLSQRLCLGWAYSIFCLCEYSLVVLNGSFWTINLYEFSTEFGGIRITSIRREDPLSKTPPYFQNPC